MSKLQPIRGTKDLLPDNFKIHDYIIRTTEKISALYGYSTMSTPIIEYSRVFDRTLGVTSDVVSKEMYSFLDKSNESISLRPEFTAGIMRSFIHHGVLLHQLPLKFFSYGPVFRYDRPQTGRQRQFHQLNFEHIGANKAYSDAEIIKLAVNILTALGLEDKVVLEINSLGCNLSRKIYETKLIEYLQDYLKELSPDSVSRFDKNPMRILDSKDETDKKIIANAPIITDYYTDFAKEYFEEVLKYLDLLEVKYIIQPRLVRGLDYYCHTAFEFTTSALGAQSTILAGGRYDGLAKLMGGADTPAIGFAAGIERIALIREYNIENPSSVSIFPIEKSNLEASLVLADKLRQQNINTIIDAESKLSKRLQRALARNTKYVIFIGDEEQKKSVFRVKNLENSTECLVDIKQLFAMIKAI